MDELNALFAEIDAAAQAYHKSIERGLALAAEMYSIADGIDVDHGNALAELAEWV